MEIFSNDTDNLRNVNRMEQMQEKIADYSEHRTLRHTLTTGHILRSASNGVTVSHASRTILIACLSALVMLSTVLSKQAHAQNTSTKANVMKETRLKVENIRLKHSEFKLSPEAQECMDGKVIDPECDPVINGEADLFVKKLRVDEHQRVVDERERLLTNVHLAREHIGVVLGLVQLGLFCFDDRSPSKNADFMSIVMESQSTSTEVMSLFNDLLGRKKQGEKFNSKTDSARLINLANKHLESANSLKAQITSNETFKKQIAAMYLQAASSLEMAKQILAQKTGH